MNKSIKEQLEFLWCSTGESVEIEPLHFGNRSDELADDAEYPLKPTDLALDCTNKDCRCKSRKMEDKGLKRG